QGGYLAGLLAGDGFTSGEYGIEGPRGFAHVQSSVYDLSKVTDRIGTHFDLRENTYKPFPCGIVIHPTIDACIQIARTHAIKPCDIAAVHLRVAPLVLDLCNKKQISVGLEGKFSVFHGAAIGLVRGKAGLAEFTDEAGYDPDIKTERLKTTAIGDPGVAEDAARAELELANGQRIVQNVEHAIGNLARPMTDRELEEKFRDQAARVLPSRQVSELIAQCWKTGELADVRELIATAVPRA